MLPLAGTHTRGAVALRCMSLHATQLKCLLVHVVLLGSNSQKCANVRECSYTFTNAEGV